MIEILVVLSPVDRAITICRHATGELSLEQNRPPPWQNVLEITLGLSPVDDAEVCNWLSSLANGVKLGLVNLSPVAGIKLRRVDDGPNASVCRRGPLEKNRLNLWQLLDSTKVPVEDALETSTIDPFGGSRGGRRSDFLIDRLRACATGSDSRHTRFRKVVWLWLVRCCRHAAPLPFARWLSFSSPVRHSIDRKYERAGCWRDSLPQWGEPKRVSLNSEWDPIRDGCPGLLHLAAPWW